MRYADFSRCAFIVLTSFFIYYVIFIMVPVTGPMFYYLAVGTDDIARGVFPNLGNYFNFHQEMLPTPGYTDGFFYQMVIDTHDAGERPTAAFPSSHVGITTVLMWLAWKAKSRRLLLWMLPFYVLLCLSTVYIMAHYVVDVIAGLVTGTLFFWGLYLATANMKDK
jgi:membrane-associated phospholipid phosphatase